MFAVLFGGAVALLPIVATDILMVGASGLGFLRAAPALGSCLMGILLTSLPPIKKGGRLMVWCVVGFGLATIGFGLSRNFYLSWVMLFLTGAFDNISVVVRSTVLQVFTPEELRGRTSSVRSMFIISSNEIGAFESGVTAQLFGTVPAIVLGGGLSILIALGARRWAKQLMQLNFEKLGQF
jgi:MFS family permease